MFFLHLFQNCPEHILPSHRDVGAWRMPNIIYMNIALHHRRGTNQLKISAMSCSNGLQHQPQPLLQYRYIIIFALICSTM